jgi:hypothetical protein
MPTYHVSVAADQRERLRGNPGDSRIEVGRQDACQL